MGSSQGPAIDRAGVDIVDPTKNVLDLVEQAITRLNDLMAASTDRLDGVISMNDRRQDDLREAVAECVTAVSTTRAEYDDKLRNAESNRIDAIRAVDVAAIAAERSASETRAVALQTQVVASAEALRNQVAEAAIAASTALTAALDPIQKDIADLRRVQYEGVGSKTQVVESQQQGAASWGVIAGIGGVITLILLILGLYLASHRSTAAPAKTPVVVVNVPKTATTP